MRIDKQLLIATVALGLIVGGCGSGGPSTAIDVTLKEFQLSPNQWTVAAGQEITIEIANKGTVKHEWVLLKDGVTITSESELPATEEELVADFIYWEEEVAAGESNTFTFTAPAAGTYQVICAIEEHFNSGMKGELISE